MSFRFAFAGFRHGHIQSLYRKARETEGMEVVAACEEDASAREELKAKGAVEITHADFERMLREIPCDIVAIGEYFVGRGGLAVRALSEGKHVIVDKPLCTRLSEVDEMERLCREKGLKVGCMLTMRGSPQMIGLRNRVRAGAIGEVHAISFGGQHPLSLGSRAAWYFEPGKHGGTINDIGVHAVDIIPWITGLEFSTVEAARCWNAFAPEFPHFEDGAQMMLKMDNGCGVLGDVSYFMPSHVGYSLPFYWRMTLWGRRGILETSSKTDGIQAVLDEGRKVEMQPLPEGDSGAYLASFLKDIGGEIGPDELDTDAVLQSARTVLTIQKAADDGAYGVAL